MSSLSLCVCVCVCIFIITAVICIYYCEAKKNGTLAAKPADNNEEKKVSRQLVFVLIIYTTHTIHTTVTSIPRFFFGDSWERFFF